MEQHHALTDGEFEAAFASAALGPSVFTHEAHLRLAWIHVSKYGEAMAVRNITGQLRQYVRHLGATGKYNETLTVAAIKAVKHFMQKTPCATFGEFIQANPRLKHHFKEIIGQHYGFDIFKSERAKEQYLEPDLLEFS